MYVGLHHGGGGVVVVVGCGGVGVVMSEYAGVVGCGGCGVGGGADNDGGVDCDVGIADVYDDIVVDVVGVIRAVDDVDVGGVIVVDGSVCGCVVDGVCICVGGGVGVVIMVRVDVNGIGVGVCVRV